MKQGISSKIIRNTIFNIVGRLWGIIVVLFLTPYIISHIGIERYGIWALVIVVTGYFGLLDFGIGTSYRKYISEFYTTKDYKKINQVINTGFAFYSLFTILIVTFGFFAIKFIIIFLRIPLSLYRETSFVFLVGIMLFGITSVFIPFRAIQSGLQKMDIVNKVDIAVSMPMILGTIYFLEKGYGLIGLMINNAIIVIISSIVNVVIAFRILPELKFNPFLFNKEIFKKLFSFGYKLQISRFANLVSFQTDKLLITYFLGIGLVVFYQLGSSILQRVRQIPLFLISALVPAVAELDAKRDKESIIKLYLRGSKYLIFVSTPILFFLTTNASLIMLAWMGQGYDSSALVIQILAIGYFAATITGVASSITAGVARTELDMKFGIFMAILNLFLSIVLIIKIGFIGVVLGTTIALTVSSLYFLSMFHKYLELPLREFIRLLYKPINACIISVILMILLNYFLLPIKISSGRLINLSFLTINLVMFSVVYIIVILFSRYFDDIDRDLLGNKVPFLKFLLR